jgi:hypothetical protein
MTHSAFGDNMVGKVLNIGATSLEHCNFHAALLIEMHVERRLCEVVVLMEITCKALRQFAFSMVVHIDQRRHTRMGPTDFHGCLLQASAGEVPDRLRAVLITPQVHEPVKLNIQVIVDCNGHAVHFVLAFMVYLSALSREGHRALAQMVAIVCSFIDNVILIGQV